MGMRITSTSIVNGYFKDEIGHRGAHIFKGKKPSYSFQLSWEDLPKNTVSLALIFIDHDAIPVCGFSWIHWTVANIDPSLKELPENASATLNLLQGVTSWSSGILPDEWRLSKEEDAGFGGCAPPDREHLYTIELYALDKYVQLPHGFWMNDLLKAMKGHILDKCSLEALYKSKH
jgi:Raf kinase inhibitor-like YbhB/YbcL family protein